MPVNQASLQRVPNTRIKNLSPLERVAEAEEVADAVVFLCSPAASYINGTSLVIDAGLTGTVQGR